jgi:hypothetical protein
VGRHGENPFVPKDQRLAYEILGAHGFALPWIEERRDLLRDRELLLAALDKAWRLRGRAPASFRADAAALNARIRSRNLTVPVVGMRVKLFDVDAVLAELSQDP